MLKWRQGGNMENIDNEQIVVAYRESKRAHKKAVKILLGLFVLFSIILSIVCFSDDELMILYLYI